YLVCHGAEVQGGPPELWLEGEKRRPERENGPSAPTTGEKVATALTVANRPRLVVLASCFSGVGETTADNDGRALAAVGPKLVESGIPAVLAMQGQVTAQTAGEFLGTFFKELNDHGVIDRAAALARVGVEGRHDHWMPVLFSRLSDGKLWSAAAPGEKE